MHEKGRRYSGLIEILLQFHGGKLRQQHMPQLVGDCVYLL